MRVAEELAEWKVSGVIMGTSRNLSIQGLGSWFLLDPILKNPIIERLYDVVILKNSCNRLIFSLAISALKKGAGLNILMIMVRKYCSFETIIKLRV